MAISEHEQFLERLRQDVDEARLEFNLAKKELTKSREVVHDIGVTTSDGISRWRGAIGRYNRAAQAYWDALNKFTEALLS